MLLLVTPCPSVNRPPEFWDFLAPYSLEGSVAFVVVEFSLSLMTLIFAASIWEIRRYVTSPRWRWGIIVATPLSVLYGVATTFMFGRLVLWGDAVGVWFDRATNQAIASQSDCWPAMRDTISFEHTHVLNAYNGLASTIFWMVVLLVVFGIIFILVYRFLGRRRSNISSN
jgi:hypothetical protein